MKLRSLKPSKNLSINRKDKNKRTCTQHSWSGLQDYFAGTRRTKFKNGLKKDYFPITECLEVCKAMKHERGEAALIKRDGQLLNGIKLYLWIIEKIDLSIILDDMCRIE